MAGECCANMTKLQRGCMILLHLTVVLQFSKNACSLINHPDTEARTCSPCPRQNVQSCRFLSSWISWKPQTSFSAPQSPPQECSPEKKSLNYDQGLKYFLLKYLSCEILLQSVFHLPDLRLHFHLWKAVSMGQWVSCEGMVNMCWLFVLNWF